MEPTPFSPEVFHIPFPCDFDDEEVSTMLQRANSYASTSEAILQILEATSQPIPAVTPLDRTASLNAFGNPTASNLAQIKTTAASLHLTALLNEFDISVVQDAQQIRNLCTNRLILLATTGKSESTQLRAIENLGKIKDVGLFTDITVVQVHEMKTTELQAALREKINRMRTLVSMNAVEDVPFSDVSFSDATQECEK